MKPLQVIMSGPVTATSILLQICVLKKDEDAHDRKVKMFLAF